MSATNRGKQREKNDFYATPFYAIENLLDKVDLNEYGEKVLEPSAGSGNICRVFKKYYPNKRVTALELRKEEMERLTQCSDEVIIGDYLQIDMKFKYNIIIGNPPYSRAMEFVNKSLEILEEDGILILLLRTSFLESKKRYDFWQENKLSGLYVLSKRPSFTGKGTDATSYSWFIWNKKAQKQCIHVI